MKLKEEILTFDYKKELCNTNVEIDLENFQMIIIKMNEIGRDLPIYK